MIDKIVTHKIHGGIWKVLELLPNSRTKYKCKDIDKGKGWCNETRKYVGVKTKGGWYLGKNHCYGRILTFHKKDIYEKKTRKLSQQSKNITCPALPMTNYPKLTLVLQLQ